LDKAKENFLLASELGDVLSMLRLGQLLDQSDPQRWRWWGRAAALGNSWKFLSSFNPGRASAAVMFAMGRALHGHVNEHARTIFSESASFVSWVGPAKKAIAFYEAQIKATKDAVHAWTQVGIKLKVVKDVRKLIAKLIWDSREEALYDVSERREQEKQEEQEEEEEEQEEQEEQEPQPSARSLRAQKRARK
jgi:hypothetical protein